MSSEIRIPKAEITGLYRAVVKRLSKKMLGDVAEPVGVGRLLAGLHKSAPHARTDAMVLNGAPALRIELDGQLDTAISVTLDNGRITHIYAIRNPHKLARLDQVAELSR